MATKRRKVRKTRKRSCKNGKLKKPIKTKSGRRCKKRRMRMMSQTKTRKKNKVKYGGGGGGGGGPTYCKKCTDLINHYKIPNKTPAKIASIVPYSTLAKMRKDCYNCLMVFKNNKKRVPSSSYESALRQLIPQTEKIQKAMEIQRKDKTVFKDIMWEDMTEHRIKNLRN